VRFRGLQLGPCRSCSKMFNSLQLLTILILRCNSGACTNNRLPFWIRNWITHFRLYCIGVVKIEIEFYWFVCIILGNACPVSYENLLLGSHLDDFGFDRCRQSSSTSSSSLKCQGQTQAMLYFFRRGGVDPLHKMANSCMALHQEQSLDFLGETLLFCYYGQKLISPAIRLRHVLAVDITFGGVYAEQERSLLPFTNDY